VVPGTRTSYRAAAEERLTFPLSMIASPERGGGIHVGQVMVTIRFEGDADELFEEWQRAVELWEKDFGSRGPATVVAKGEHGGLFVVNVFPSEDAHTYFGRNIGGPMEAVGLSNPQLEHLDVLRVAFENL
jgi:hypothetical protein